MHVTLINPPFTFTSKSEIVYSQCIGIGYIAAYLKKNGGHNVKVVDAFYEGNHQISVNDNLNNGWFEQ